ncbi:translocation/assembly module TamB domain-containing protein [Mucilaginibacter paludis]|uniref:translocation/assembly module TamB domain-containing protein n=1 Tax=Mucilaginibacter paludis TaxID=423351 RepID=UPI0002F68897|nr:translocation/assembly module TamB domain-containing protein [Mucilaginibacter paludis]
MIISILLAALQYKPVQTWAAKKATAYLSKELGTTVSIKSLYIKPFSSIVLEDLFVLDQQKDTLLRTPLLTVELANFHIFSSIKKRVIDFKVIQLDNGSFYLKKLKDSSTNLSFIINHFKSKDTVKTKGKPWTINFEKLVINNLRFRYKNYLSNEVSTQQVNFNDVDVQQFTTVLTDIDLKNHLFKANIHDLSLKEKTGFYVKHFVANATVDTNQILLKQLFIQTNRSNLKNYFRMRFNSFDDFDDFENTVKMDADFKESRISSLDVAYFTNSLQQVYFDLGIDGRIQGLVNNLKAKKLTVTAGQATYIKGDFSLKGLPNWDKTFLELQFEQIATNKKDIDLLYSRFTGKKNQHVPDIIAKFGNINFKGQFTGFQNDFIAYGEFKTRLGRFNSDINLKLDKANVPSYSGKLTTFDFNIGDLLNQDILGRTTLTANIKGRGTELKQLTEQLDAKIKYFDFKGYRYNNLSVNGTFEKKKFDGKVLINDHNINLDFNGNVNLNPALPVFNFTAAIKGANLNKLKLYKDTITVDANLTSNFSGNNINNIDGSILLKNIRLVKPHADFLVDSIYFAASGKEKDRQLILRSDIADGGLKGNYDLASLPAYFKAVAKKYIPSLAIPAVIVKPQNFEFNLKIKNLNPVSILFVPALKLTDTATFQGKFNSVDRTAILTGSVKSFKYDKIVFHDLIIDENTTDDMLDLNLSLSKVDLTDSLFIKNINITNFLKRDSLNFNIKLSDKNATNQLDLYGLVQFGKDTTAKLSLLPSDIILEHNVWKLKDQVRIRFLAGGRTQIDGLGISNGNQKVTIDGFLSADPKDILGVNFSKFDMATLNQLSRPFGIALKGALNGDVKLSAVTTQPGIESNLAIDSLAFNKTLIGNVKFVTQLDNINKVLNTKINIMNRGLETLNATGTYNLASADNSLDFSLTMNQTEAVIIEPFVKSLISDLKGALSSDLKLTGTLSKPSINGNLTFVNTGLTVNYLKTPYVINDKVTVENSVVKINNLVLRDSRGGEGVTNGTVDLTEISNPTLNVTLKATNLLALNTTFKDNRIYYGTAYGTGNFSFVGPIDNMRIDIKAKTQDGTVFNIPLNTSSKAAEYDFIRFVSSKDTTKLISRENSFKGVTLNFELSADEKTIVKIATDYGLLTGSGTANGLSLKINSLGDFDMYGDFLISTGKFEFTAKDFITKNFQVNQGGTIRWTGNPSNAEINLKAIYEVRTNIAALYQAAGLQSPKENQQELVQAELILTKSLTQPQFDFDFNFPTDPSIKDELGTYLNDYTNRSQQALSLIVRRNFASGTSSNTLTSQVRQTAQDALSEFAFNKLNSFIAQSNIKNFDLNIRSTSDASASLHFFNDRILINGSLYDAQGSNELFGNNQSLFNSNFSNLTKDFGVQYLIKADGSLLATYSYRVLNSTTLNTINQQLGVQYVNGLGLVYRRDFDTFNEFFKNIFRRRRTPPKKKPVNNTNSNPAIINDRSDE